MVLQMGRGSQSNHAMIFLTLNLQPDQAVHRDSILGTLGNANIPCFLDGRMGLSYFVIKIGLQNFLQPA